MPAQGWICTSRANPLVMKFVDQDETDDVYTCYRWADVEHGARIAYYAFKLVSLLP